MRTPSMLAIAAILTALGGAAVLSGPAPSPDEPLVEYWRAHPRSPLDYVVDKFADNKWVFLGEYHRIRYDVDLVRSLVPRLHERTKVRHLAMEFLCRERTEQANRMATAAEWDRSSAIDFFREQFPGWAYEEYLDIFRVVWESNRRLAAEHGAFKLVGLHPCIDWEVVHYGTDPEAVRREKREQQRYDEIMAEALETELLKKDLPALVFTGIAHSTAKFPEYWVGTDRPLPRMGNMVYRDPYRKEMFFIALHAPFYDSGADREIYPFDGALDRSMARYRTSIGFDVVGTPLEDLRHRESDPHSITAFRFGELFDGYVIFATPIKEYVGVGCIEEWITDEAQFRYYWRHLSNKEASERFSEIPFEEFVGDFCAPRPGQGEQFHSRFRRLPELN